MLRLALAALIVAYGLAVGGASIDLIGRVVAHRAHVLEIVK